MDKLTRMLRRCAAAVITVAASMAPTQAMDLSWSGFATVGYAQSNQDFHYLRWIDDGGTFNTETVAGLQLDLRFSPHWSATVQLRAAPATDHDSRWDVEPGWAFVAWRPNDDWLLRAGKLRVPLYLYSEVLDVGAAYDMARLPVEMYSLSPIDELVGFSVGYDWRFDAAGEYLLNMTLFSGGDEVTTRGWVPNGIPPLLPSGASFLDTDAWATGLVFDLTMPDTRLRALVLRARAKIDGGSPKNFPRVELGGGLGYYKVADAFPGPPLDYQDVVHNDLYALGAEHRFAGGWRVAAEYARIVQHDVDLGSDSHGGYVALFKELGRFTPYASLGRLKSTDDQLDITRNLASNSLPLCSLQSCADVFINAAQQAAAAQSYATDQRTFALGTSMTVPGGKLKLEWARTWVDDTSRLIDERPGEALIEDRQINVWTLNYSVAF